MPPTLEESRELLLGAVRGADVTFLRYEGNRGDDLIEAGTRALLGGAGIPYSFVHVDGAESVRTLRGDLLLLGGGGGWCRYWAHSPEVMASAHGFARAVVFPSSFDTTDARTRHSLKLTKARLFSREEESARRVPRSTLAHCPSFFTDLSQYQRSGSGTLLAYRTDHESARGWVPDGNDDISLTRSSLEEWLGAIAGAEEVRTDRAHVMIAAALLGKRVRWRDCGYFKVRSMARTWLRGYDVKEEK
jgi:hypothetical protein